MGLFFSASTVCGQGEITDASSKAYIHRWLRRRRRGGHLSPLVVAGLDPAIHWVTGSTPGSSRQRYTCRTKSGECKMSTRSRHMVRAIDGSPLVGRRLVRIVYLDESGTSRGERLAVVAGVMIDADNQLIAVEEHMERLVERYIPEDDRGDFFFHATNIWSGTKYFKDRDLWPLERRLEILHDLVEIPQKFDIPVVFGHCPRDEPITVF